MQLIESPNDQDAAPEGMPAQANSDDTLIALWLAGKADRTRRAYQDDVNAFLRFVDKSLRQITLADLVSWSETLSEMAPASRARKLGAMKSLAAFGHRIGYLAFDIGAPLRLPAVKTTLAERILGEGDVLRLLTLETNPRNHAVLRLLYAGALRVLGHGGVTLRPCGMECLVSECFAMIALPLRLFRPVPRKNSLHGV
jgi:integrase/recombinase XerD